MREGVSLTNDKGPNTSTARLNVLCVGSLSKVGRDPTVHVSRGDLSVSPTGVVIGPHGVRTVVVT